ncbi:hypothetical protein Bca4012_023892 [Brassica carinata]
MGFGAYMSYLNQSSFLFMRRTICFFTVMLCLMINKLSGGITYEEREGLADPMRKEVALARKVIDSVNK